MALLDLLVGYERAILIDAVKTGRTPPGTIAELSPADLGAVAAPSPHATAQALNLDFPKEIKIFAIEVEDPHTIGRGLSPTVAQALGKLIPQVERQVTQWLK
jgi:hydrogenase maturation protease